MTYNEEGNDNILHVEMQALWEDIIEAYNSSGKRTSGEFEKGLQIQYAPNKAVLIGYTYLGGRTGGKMPPVAAIEKWLVQKGIAPIEKKLSISSLAFLIARKIAKEGTNKENNLPIYTQVVTPERIDEILEKIDKLNVSKFIQDVQGMITKAFNEFQ